MERRTNPRRSVKASVVCEPFSSPKSGATIEGYTKNCCLAGFYAELKKHLQTGAILVVQMGGYPTGYSANEGVGSMALAEVRWSKPEAVEEKTLYNTGLRYLKLFFYS